MKPKRRSISKTVWSAALYLLAGAITTVAVAWIVVLTVDELPENGRTITHGWLAYRNNATGAVTTSIVTEWRFRTKYRLVATTHATPNTEIPDDASHDPAQSLTHSIPTWCREYFREFIEQPSASDRLELEARGWPRMALWCGPTDSPNASGPGNIPYAGIPVDDNGIKLSRRALPMLPIWSGFLVDSLFYGGILYAIFLLLTGSRRLARYCRGRCPRCGYEWKNAGDNIPGCPECGFGRDTPCPAQRGAEPTPLNVSE